MGVTAEITGIVEAMARFAAAFDPALVSCADAEAVLRASAQVENMAAATKAAAARRAAEGAVWRRAGKRSSAEWLSGQIGVSVGQARQQLETAERLARLPLVADAARAGQLSAPQAAAIADAAAAAPTEERRLLDVARREPLVRLREECQRAKAAADPDPEATYRRIRQRRRLVEYTDAEGGWNLQIRDTPDVGALVHSTLAPLVEELFAAARREGRHESHEAYAADALAELCRRHAGASRAAAGRATKTRVRHLALLRVDLEALVRGAVEGDELCELTGIGPVPATRARELLGESVLKLVLTRGTDVATVVHLGRGPNAAQKIALLWSQPLCANEACTNRWHTQSDHRTPWTACHTTTLDNLDQLCPHDHQLKTTQAWALVDGKGRRPFVPPDDPRHPRFWKPSTRAG